MKNKSLRVMCDVIDFYVIRLLGSLLTLFAALKLVALELSSVTEFILDCLRR